MGSFTRKGLRFTLVLADGENFGPAANNATTLVLDNLWATVTSSGVLSSLPAVEVDIYGMRAGDMDALTAMAFLISTIERISNNSLTVEASNNADDPSAWSQIFSGTIYEAYPDFSGAPNTRFHLAAFGGYAAQLQPLPDTVINGNADVRSVAKGIIAKLPGSYRPNDTLTTSPIIAKSLTLSGNGIQQLTQLGEMAGINITPVLDQIYITDKKIPPTDPNPRVLSAATGMIGYPVFTRQGLLVRALFEPHSNSNFTSGQISIQSQLKYANGLWSVYAVSHSLSTHAESPSWETTYSCLVANGGKS